MTRVVAPDVQRRSLPGLWSLTGRVAVVTGGASGIGAATALRLAEAGASVMIGDVDLDLAKQVVNRGVANGVDGTILEASELDVRDPASVERFAATCVERFGCLDIWVNSAGIWPSGDVLSTSVSEWDEVMDVNLKGAWLSAREAARHMDSPERRAVVPGVIVGIEALAGHRGRTGAVHYVASKHGLVGLTRALAAELGPLGIRVLGVTPTLTETPGVQRQRKHDDASTASPDDDGRIDLASPTRVQAQLTTKALLGRTAVADDVARVVLFAVSDMAILMTGSSLFVDAGVLVS